MLEGLLARTPGHAEASLELARIAWRGGDTRRAIAVLEAAHALHPGHASLGVELAVARLNTGADAQAVSALEATVSVSPDACIAWLLLGRVHDLRGDRGAALEAWYQAVTRAQQQGRWLDEGSTPPALLDAVLEAIERVRQGRRELLFASYDDVVRSFGPQSMQRVARALTGYIDGGVRPADSRQRPRFFYFPDLPSLPYLDPQLQPWAPALEASFDTIRTETLNLVESESRLPDFIDLKRGDSMSNYLGGSVDPSWEAFFFYRHGRRYDDNHVRCPRTSALLESIELCRIADHAPEICLSVLRPHTEIKPHYGVTNTRVVMHLPLLVPPGCALNVIGAGERTWEPGRLLMFDDTFQHEAWNRSDQTRVILLMDCWNPHLRPEERQAVERIIVRIGSLHRAGSGPAASA